LQQCRDACYRLVAIILSMFNGRAVLVLPAFRVRQFLELAARERMTHTVLVGNVQPCLLDPGFTRRPVGLAARQLWRCAMPGVDLGAQEAPHLSHERLRRDGDASPTSAPIGEAWNGATRSVCRCIARK
jgi:hypothetical protein